MINNTKQLVSKIMKIHKSGHGSKSKTTHATYTRDSGENLIFQKECNYFFILIVCIFS